MSAESSTKTGAYPVAILAGGLATRMRPLTEKIPKHLLEVNGEPFVAHQLRILKANGISRVVICAGFLGEMIEEYVRGQGSFGLDVQFSYDGPSLLGTAGALKRALPLLGSDGFFVMYGDSYLTCDYRAVGRAFAASGKQALMTVFHNENKWETSNVEFCDGKILAYEKKNRTPRMKHVDYGLGVLKPEAFDSVPTDQPRDLASLYSQLLVRGELAAYEVPERFYEIGSFEGLKETSELLAKTSQLKDNPMNFTEQFLAESAQIIQKLDDSAVEKMVDVIAAARAGGGRLFILGVGGSAANASHAVNDFRKIVGMETYAPTDNVSELTARTNDEGWATIFESWLKGSRLKASDLIMVFSVGGGNLEKNVSPNLVNALKYAKSIGTKVVGIVGRDGGYTAQVADACVIVPTVNAENVTPHAEAFQAVVWHLMVSHPKLKVGATKWESVK